MSRLLCTLFPTLGLLLLLGACEHKELCYDHPHTKTVRVVYHWNAADTKPASMRVFFYRRNQAGHAAPYVFDFGNAQGGTIDLPHGEYDVLSFNTDTENIFVRGEQSLATIEVGTNPVPWPRSLVRSTGKEALVVESPDYLYRAMRTDVCIESDVRAEVEQVIELHPRPAVCRYTYEVHGVKNLSYARQIKGTLSNISASLLIGANVLTPTPHEVLFDGHDDNGVVRGEFWVFNTVPPLQQNDTHTFSLYMRTTQSYVNIDVNVAEQIYSFPIEGGLRNVHLVLHTNVELPIPIAEEGGFVPDVEDWGTIEKEISI